MNITHSKCPCCKSNKISEIYKNESFPAILFPIEEEKRDSVSTKDIHVWSCESCDHLFQNCIDIEFQKNLYKDYYYLYPYGNLETMGSPYREPFNNIFKIFTEKNSSSMRLLEIGCANVEQLNYFIDSGFACTGVSPGADREYPHILIDGFYEDLMMRDSFDVIVSRFNLEHILDLDRFMSKIFNDLNDDGLVFIQVPNVSSFLGNGVISVFAHEHPHYFSKNSLVALFSRFEFQIECIKAREMDSSIIVVLSKDRTTPKVSKQVLENIKSIEEVNKIISNHSDSDLYFYGAGLSLSGLLYLDPQVKEIKSRLFLIDDNALLTGKFMPNTNIRVQCEIFRPENTQSRILFVLLSSIYHETVLGKIDIDSFDAIYVLDKNGLRIFASDET